MRKVKQKTASLYQRIAKRRRDYIAARPHRSFRKTKLPKTRPVLATVKQNSIATAKLMWRERRLFAVLSLVYMAVTYIFVGGIAQADFVELKQATAEVFGGSFNSFSTVLSVFTSTVSGAFSSELTELQQVLSVFIGLLFWLTIVWALRMRLANETIRARDALYTAGAPLIATIVVGLFVILQLTPGALGIILFNYANSGGFLQGGVEVMTFVMLAVLLGALSLYWVAGSLIALVVVTLPQMYPWKAVQIASELAVYRRLRLMGHIAVLVCTMALLWLIGLLPVMLIDAWLRWDWLPLVPIMVQLLSTIGLAFSATYVYKLYRSML